MTDPIIITLSGEPQGKGRPRFVRSTGHAFTPANTRRYESALRLAAQQAMGQRAPIEGPVKVEVTAAFPIPQSWPKWRKERALAGQEWAVTKPDADNLLKCLDACDEIVWRDDKQIVLATISKVYSERPQLTVVIEPLAVVPRVVKLPKPKRAIAASLDLAFDTS